MARKPNVLLVDDYEVNLDLLEAYLELSGIPLEIYKARNGKEAYAIIEGWNKDNLTSGQTEIIEELKNIEENPYPFEEVEYDLSVIRKS